GVGGEPSAPSHADGTYAIVNVPNGTYDLRTQLPAGLLSTVPASGKYTVVVSGTDITGRDFGQIEANSIQGTVFHDHNGNGTQDVGDEGLARTVFLDTNNNGSFDAGAAVNSGPGSVGIVPDNTPAGADFTVVTAGYVGAVTDINVNIDITMTWDG